MNKHQQLAIRALQNMRGDDLYRAEMAFKGLTEKQMHEQHGQSGKTRQQILDEYRRQTSEVDAAIKWVQSV